MTNPATADPGHYETVRLHGHDVCFRRAGDSGPGVVLLHGITSSGETWLPVLPLLSQSAQVIVPDMLGHGLSAKPRGDYSLGAYASGVRDLLALLGHDRVTVVGHSLGGGVAMQFAYQYPERCERLVLVSSGGLGKGVSAALRAASLPGAELVLPVIAHRRVLAAGTAVGSAMSRLGRPVPPALAEVARGYASLSDKQTRAAFLATLRSVVDPRGQRVDARDRLYLARHMPSLLVWGRRDAIIPAGHGLRAHEQMPGSRLEVFERAGHFPHCEEPERFAKLLLEFIASTQPAHVDHELMRRELAAAAG